MINKYGNNKQLNGYLILINYIFNLNQQLFILKQIYIFG